MTPFPVTASLQNSQPLSARPTLKRSHPINSAYDTPSRAVESKPSNELSVFDDKRRWVCQNPGLAGVIVLKLMARAQVFRRERRAGLKSHFKNRFSRPVSRIVAAGAFSKSRRVCTLSFPQFSRRNFRRTEAIFPSFRSPVQGFARYKAAMRIQQDHSGQVH